MPRYDVIYKLKSRRLETPLNLNTAYKDIAASWYAIYEKETNVDYVRLVEYTQITVKDSRGA